MKLPKLFNGRRVHREQIAEMQRLTTVLSEYAAYQITGESMRQRLGELDPHLVNLLVDMSQYERIIGGGFTGAESRLRTVKLSRSKVKTDVQIANAVKTWTDWGFGRNVNIKALDPNADEVWQATWTTPINKPIFKEETLHEHSNRTLVDGDFFFVDYASRVDGSSRWRYFKTERVTSIIHSPLDDAINLYYVVDIGNGTQAAYPDAFAWFALRGEFESVKLPQGIVDVNALPQMMNSQTFASIIPVQRNIDEDDGRGWPQFYRAFSWSDVYAQMLREYSQVFSAVAAYVDKIKADGGQRTINDIITSLQSGLASGNSNVWDSNPAPTAGATWGENQAMERTRLPLGSAAGDAQAGTLVIGTQLATALGVKLSDIGRPDAFQNKATADIAAESPQQGWQRYQNFWASIWQQVVEITLRVKTEFTNQTFESYESAVSMSLPINIETSEIKQGMDAVTNAAQAGMLDMGVANRTNKALTTLLLLDFNVSDVGEIIEPPTQAEADNAPTAAHLGESHTPVLIAHTCPLCGHAEAESYAGHGPLLRCAGCGKTYDPEVE